MSIKDLRDKIDDLDNQIITLLNQRMKVVEEVGLVKRKSHESFFVKSAREADMIKNLLPKASSKNLRSIIPSIWRKIISASNITEQDLKIAIYNPDKSSDIYYMVREYYNNIIPIIEHESATKVIALMEKGEAQIGVFELPSDEDFANIKSDSASIEDWWINLAGNNCGIKIFAVISDVSAKGEQKNLALAAVKEPEKSLEDFTLIYIESEPLLSKSEMSLALRKAGFEHKILRSIGTSLFKQTVFHLIEIDGFYNDSEEINNRISSAEMRLFTRIIGHYPKRIITS